jgi:hypothetical protein
MDEGKLSIDPRDQRERDHGLEPPNMGRPAASKDSCYGSKLSLVVPNFLRYVRVLLPTDMAIAIKIFSKLRASQKAAGVASMPGKG